MNERIKQLAEQVHVAGDPWKNKDEPEYMWYNFREDALEKFAELIVRECANIIQAEKDTGLYNAQLRAGMSVSKAVIKEHFGVEE